MVDAVRSERATRVFAKALRECAAAWEEFMSAWNEGAEAFEQIRRADEAATALQVNAYVEAQDRIAKAWKLCEQKRASLDGAGAEYRAATGYAAAPDLSQFRIPPWTRLPTSG
jgi:hypothetical protein